MGQQRSILHHTTFRGRAAAAGELLLEKGANIGPAGSSGATALYIAAYDIQRW